MKLIMSLKRTYESFRKELLIAEDAPYPEYYRFLKRLGFGDYVEQVITACVAYPRSVEFCRDSLNDLSYGMYSDIGIGVFRLSHADQSRLSALIHNAGTEVITILESHGFYFTPNQMPKGACDDPAYIIELTAVPTVQRIGQSSFKVSIREYHQDDDLDEIIQQNARQNNPRDWIH